MAEFEAVSKGKFGKLLKSKNVLIFAGIGAAAGGVALLMNRGNSTEEESTTLLPATGSSSIYPTDESGMDMVSALGTIQQSFVDALGQYDELQQERTSLLFEQMTENFESQTDTMADVISGISEQNQATRSLIDEVTEQMIATQKSMNDKWASLESRIEDNAVYQSTASSSSKSSSKSSTVSGNVGKGSNADSWDGKIDGKATVKVSDDTFKNATKMDYSGSGVYKIVKHNGKTYNVDVKTGKAYY